MNNEENKERNNYSRPPDDLLSLVDNQNQSNNINLEKNDLAEKINIVETDLSNATVGLIPIERKEEVNKMTTDSLMKETESPKVALEIKTRKENKLFFGVCILSGVVFVFVLLFAIFSKTNTFKFSGSSVYYQNRIIENLGDYQTAVVTDNIYEGVSVSNSNDGRNLIIKDSNNQKQKCENQNIKEIETKIEKKYGIVAVNLCEIGENFASEIEKVIDTIYKEFPNIKGYLTNLTLINAPEYSNYIASFVSAKLFAKSNTRNTYPNVYKMSIFLNASYFLNEDYFDASIKDSVSYGYFPNNATKNSIVAHEFGHYLSFLAQLKTTSKLNDLVLLTKKNYSDYSKLISDSNEGNFSKKIINEAYENYKKTDNIQYSSIDRFRASISEYAVVMDASGKYIYDETIAEAFHDYYINRDNAKPASREIIKVLKKYLNK